jgi:hypothetical protein
MARTILTLTAVTLLVLVTQGRGREAAAAEEFSAEVSVVVTDDAPLSHPDTITTIDIPNGEPLGQVRTLTPLGGTVAAAKDIPDGTYVGWISGFSTIPKPDGSCGQRFNFDADLRTAPVDPSLMPPYLRDIAPGPHIIRFEADIAGTPVNMFFDHVQIEGETRLVISTYIGSPTTPPPPPPCGPFRTRVTINGMAGATPVITAPPTAGEPQVQELALTTRPDSSGHLGAEVAERTVALVVQPALQVRIEGDGIQWNALPDAASYSTGGRLIYSTTCEQVRRLIMHEEYRSLDAELPSSATSMAFPLPSDPTLERAQVDAEVIAYDSDKVPLARENVNWVSDHRSCRYAPGTEPLLSVEPTSGECDGEVTFRGSRFPTDVRVEIAMIAYGTDYPGGSVGTSAVAPDGTFTMTTRLPTRACAIASGSPQGEVFLAAYNADQPMGMEVFASTRYSATVPEGAARFVAAPATGAAPSAGGVSWPLFAAVSLAFAGAASVGAGLILFMRMRTFRRAA